MSNPTLIVEVAFDTNPFATPTWTDVSAYVKSVSVRRGKSNVLDNMQAGSCSVLLDNSDGRFDPNNTSSPYSPNVLPMRRVRVKAETDSYVDEYSDTYVGGSYGLFSGFVEAWPQPYGGLNHAQTPMTAVDGFKVLNLHKLSATYIQELSSTRVTNILDDVSWPSGDRSIDTGQSTVQAATLDSGNALAHLLTVADSEAGLLYVDRDGNLRFLSRHGLIGGVLDTTNYTFGDGSGEKVYDDITVEFDDRDVWNDIEVSSQGVATQTASDATSQTTYLTRTLAKSGLLLTSTTEQKNLADFLLSSHKDPELRVERIVFRFGADWDRILDRDLGSKVLVKRRPPGSADVISQGSFVEGISWTVTPSSVWTCTWDLVALTRRAEFWVLGDSVQGVLGSTTKLAY